MVENNVQELRIGLMLSKAELGRRAGISPLTVGRIEMGKTCRMETKRKIIEALGYELSEREKIFPKG